ncbi:MAG: CDP-alcohol phosphatidyltransferase family protein [Gammaproteobacteria bacterium]
MSAPSMRGAVGVERLRASSGVLGGSACLALFVFAAGRALELPRGLAALGMANVALIALAVLVLAWRCPPAGGFGLANVITLTRGGIAALLAAAVPFPQAALALAGPLAAAATLALVLDEFDGWWARRTGTACEFGARFDQEMDALLIAVLCALAYVTDRAGAWVLGAGALRYLYCVAGRIWPWLARPLPPSRRRQTICVATAALLIASLGPWLAPAAAGGAAGFAVSLLFTSFAIDIVRQYRHQPRPQPDDPARRTAPT